MYMDGTSQELCNYKKIYGKKPAVVNNLPKYTKVCFPLSLFHNRFVKDFIVVLEQSN